MSLTAIPLPQETFVPSLLCARHQATVRYIEKKKKTKKHFVIEKDTLKTFCVKEIHELRSVSVWCGRTRKTA